MNSLNLALINSNTNLAELIRKRYPIAMVDEFQDTDSQQYNIFRQIYSNQSNCCLILIGDPKQAIYSFRGANIFTYIQARQEVDAIYTINTNWRSAPGMVNAVNQLFQSIKKPFIFNDIIFLPALPTKNNNDLKLIIHDQVQPALRILLQNTNNYVNISEYQQYMADQCSFIILNWLHAANENKAWIQNPNGYRQLLQASDINILVRNRNEAILMRDALANLMIPSIYHNNNDSVFHTLEAYEILLVLEAILTPEKDAVLRVALVTQLLGLNAICIDMLNNNEQLWEQRVEEFAKYRSCWQKQGILPMLHKVIINNKIAEILLANQGGERRLTNILHIGELLQEASTKLENEFALVNWLKLQIESPDIKSINQKLRIESDTNLIKIITIFKSKGLEFPIVFLPFIAGFRMQERPLFHDRKTFQTCLDLSASPENLQLADEERLAEDLRLFYVAITRSIYHCSFGIAPLYSNSRKKFSNKNLCLNAPGYLIQQGLNNDIENLYHKLSKLIIRSGNDIDLFKFPISPKQPFLPMSVSALNLETRNWSTPKFDPWQITSYSNLQQQNKKSIETMKLQSQLETNIINWCVQQKKLEHTPHTFPRGALSGNFLHNLFETLNFSQPLNPKNLNEKLIQQGFDVIWLPTIIKWIKDVITTPLNKESFSLSLLTPDNYQTEMSFYLSIKKTIKASDLDLLCKQHDKLSRQCPLINFLQIKGILKGFIDLVFRWNGRYYLLDYKSNYLGDEDKAYNVLKIEQSMIDHRYELQYQLYTLALHRFLRYRLKDYDYQRDFGGVYYLFLRGINSLKPKNGIFYCRPKIKLINKMDDLFTGETHN